MTRTNRPHIDRELLELFGDDPESLAIVDAVQATQSIKSARIRARVVGAVAAVLAAAIIAGTFAVTRSRAGVIAHALDAWPPNRVIHVVVKDMDPSATLLDPGTGRGRPLHHLISEWYDGRSHIRRVVDSVAGVPVSDVRLRVTPEPVTSVGGFSASAVAAFPPLYRRSLSGASSHAVTSGLLDGQPVYWIHFSTPNVLKAVAIDRKTYKPMEMVLRSGATTRRFRILDANLLPAGSHVPRSRIVQKLPHAPTQTVPVRTGAALNQSVAAEILTRSRLYLVSSSDLVFFGRTRGFDLRFKSTSATSSTLLEIQESVMPQGRFGWSTTRVAAIRDGAVLLEHTGAFVALYFKAHGRAFRIWTNGGTQTALPVARLLRR